jgi:hypothetical protein
MTNVTFSYKVATGNLDIIALQRTILSYLAEEQASEQGRPDYRR